MLQPQLGDFAVSSDLQVHHLLPVFILESRDDFCMPSIGSFHQRAVVIGQDGVVLLIASTVSQRWNSSKCIYGDIAGCQSWVQG